MLGPEILDDDLACGVCGRVNVPLGTNVWLKVEACHACMCVWYDSGGSLETWDDLKVKSLASGDKWL